MVLKHIDYEEGMYITPVRGPEIRPYPDIKGAETKTKERYDKSWSGDPFIVKLVELPFVIVQFLNGPWEGKTKTFDTRRWKFKEISEKYVKTLTKED